MLLIADLDGTAIDTRGLILSSYKHVIDTYGLDRRSDEELSRYVGILLKTLYPKWASEKLYPKMFETHRAFQSENMHLVKTFPGIPEVFKELRGHGVKIGINTNRSVTGRCFIKHAGLETLVDHIVTVEDVAFPKPAPEGILAAMNSFACSRSCTWMMGDTEIDIEAGKNAGIPTIGVDFARAGSHFGTWRPDFFITTPYEILPILIPH
jgi:pyrophosphatase PpaX